MVTKPRDRPPAASGRFESCVVLDGDKTLPASMMAVLQFESCVVLDGDKTARCSTTTIRCLRVVLF